MPEQPEHAAAVRVRGLVKHYRTPGRGVVHALDGIDLDLAGGDVLGVVGESGCGKSTLARLLTALERPQQGTIEIGGQRVDTARGRRLRELRRTVQMVFQDPYASLDPRQRIGVALREVLRVHRLPSSAARVTELLAMVGLNPATADQYPHQLSGGMRQRVGVARALAVEPRVLVLDEPVSALDVSVRAEIMNLLVRLRAELGLTYIFVSHDLGMVRYLCDRIAVMYLGEIVEAGTWSAVADHAQHPYTQALQAAEPTVAVGGSRAGAHEPASPAPARGEVPDAAKVPSGCRFHPRCPMAEPACAETLQTLEPVDSGNAEDHSFACMVVQRQVGSEAV